MPINDDEGASRRQLARKAQRTAGDRSARLAHELMEVPRTTLDRLELDADVRAVVDRARGITSKSARRRDERAVAGALRAVDLKDLARRLANIQETGRADPRQFQQAEAWRTRLIAEGDAGATAFLKMFPGGELPALAKLVASARREQATGKPPGAARALFKAVMAAISAPRGPVGPTDDDEDDVAAAADDSDE